MKLLGNKILAEKLNREEKTEAGIILPVEKHKDNDLVVLMVGPKVEHVKVGDVIQKTPFNGIPYQYKGKSCLFLKEDEDIEIIY